LTMIHDAGEGWSTTPTAVARRSYRHIDKIVGGDLSPGPKLRMLCLSSFSLVYLRALYMYEQQFLDLSYSILCKVRSGSLCSTYRKATRYM
jgi:hypothetical protein